MELKKLENVIVWIKENIDREINIQKVDLLLKIAKNEGIGQQELMAATGLQSGSISRHLMRMGRFYDKRAKRERGYGLVIQTPNPVNRRQQSVYLTDKGKRVVVNILCILNGKKAAA